MIIVGGFIGGILFVITCAILDGPNAIHSLPYHRVKSLVVFLNYIGAIAVICAFCAFFIKGFLMVVLY